MSVNRHIAFGAHNEPNQKNEDRCLYPTPHDCLRLTPVPSVVRRGSMYMDHAADGCPHMASFSVFDGHNGSVAASLCAEYFNRRVVKRIQKLLGVSPASNASLEEPTSAASPLSRRDEVDAIVCESIRLSVVEIDMNIQLNHHSGCSINSLFLLFSPETSAVRVYCANLGTSRTVMFAPTIDRTWTSSRDSSCDETQDTFAGKESIATESVNSDNFSRETPVVAFLMNDSPRRSSSVDSTESDFACKPLPADPTKGQNAQGSSPDDDCAAPVGVVEQGYPAQPLMDQAERFLSAFKSTVDIGPKIYDVSAVDNMCLVIDRTGTCVRPPCNGDSLHSCLLFRLFLE